MSEQIRCVRIGHNTVNLRNFLFMRVLRTKGENSEGELTEVYLLQFTFNDKTRFELQFDTQEACEAARDFVEAHTGATTVMPDAIIGLGGE